MSKANNSPDLATETETTHLPWRRPTLERLTWRRPTLQRMSANDAEKGLSGGGDTPGTDMMS